MRVENWFLYLNQTIKIQNLLYVVREGIAMVQ